MQHLVSSLSAGGRPPTKGDDTRCCINTIQPPDDEHMMFETCGGL